MTTLQWSADIFELLLLCAGVVLFAKQSRRERFSPPENVLPWRANWADFALWLCVIIFVLGAGGVVLSHLFHVEPGAKLTQTQTLWLAGAQQGFILLAQLGILASRSTFSPGPINSERMPLSKVFAKGVLAFMAGYPLIFLTGYFWSLALEAIQHWLAPQLQTPKQTVVQLISAQPSTGIVAVSVLFAVALAPVNEELFFRVGIYRFLKGKMSTRSAIALAAIIFAAFHANLLSFAPLLVVGWLLARAYERTGHAGVPMVFHALFNLNTIAMLLISSGSM